MQPIGFLGGTFDPIHFGHLRMGLEVIQAYGLTQLHLIPCFQPTHRKLPQASAHHRLAMAKLAIHNEPAISVNSCEIDREGVSYTIDTVLTLRQQHPNTPLCMLLGIDAFLEFLNWRQPLDILQHTHIIVAHRPNYELPTTGPIAELLKRHLQQDINYIHQNQAGGILLRSITALEISATDIRKQIAAGKNPRYLLPDSVYEYINEYNLYR